MVPSVKARGNVCGSEVLRKLETLRREGGRECGLTRLGGRSRDDRHGCCVVRRGGSVPSMPKELDVLLVCDGFGVEDVLIDF